MYQKKDKPYNLQNMMKWLPSSLPRGSEAKLVINNQMDCATNTVMW